MFTCGEYIDALFCNRKDYFYTEPRLTAILIDNN